MPKEPSPFERVLADDPENLALPPGTSVVTANSEPWRTWHYPEMPAGQRFIYPASSRLGRVGMVRFRCAAAARAFLEGMYWTKPLFFQLFGALHFQYSAQWEREGDGTAWSRKQTAESSDLEEILDENNPVLAWLAEWTNQEGEQIDGEDA